MASYTYREHLGRRKRQSITLYWILGTGKVELSIRGPQGGLQGRTNLSAEELANLGRTFTELSKRIKDQKEAQRS